MTKKLTEILGIEYSILMAPMFLVSDEQMILSALQGGITAAFPAANYRNTNDLESAILSLKSKTDKPFGVNLIVNRSNSNLKSQLEVCVRNKVAFIITSLGSPREVIKQCHPKGILVFCDVTDLKYAEKVVSLGADALIAVNNKAGGHAGQQSGELLCSSLLSKFDIPVVYAGGISTAGKYKLAMSLGVSGVSIGTLFLATEESPVSEDYKKAIVNYGASDIVQTSRLSGAMTNVINTPWVQKVGLKSTLFTKFLYKHKGFRRYLKKIIMNRGMKSLERAAFGCTYKTMWVAGPAIDDIHEIVNVKRRIDDLIEKTI